jgi:hypothetical protein
MRDNVPFVASGVSHSGRSIVVLTRYREQLAAE